MPPRDALPLLRISRASHTSHASQETDLLLAETPPHSAKFRQEHNVIVRELHTRDVSSRAVLTSTHNPIFSATDLENRYLRAPSLSGNEFVKRTLSKEFVSACCSVIGGLYLMWTGMLVISCQ